MRLRYFGSRYFATDFFAASGEEAASQGGYFGSEYFQARYFKVGFYGPTTLTGAISGSLNVTENADSLTSQANIAQVESGVVGHGPPIRPPRLVPIEARLDVLELGDTLVSFARLGPDPVEMDNNLLLMAA